MEKEQLINPFEVADSIDEDGVAVVNAHASYFPDFKSSELEPELDLGRGLGSTRSSVEDVLGRDARRRGYSSQVGVRASVVSVAESERRGFADARMVVPIVTVQAPSNEDGMSSLSGVSILSSEVDPMEMTQSLDEEYLFYNGGPRAFASRTTIGRE